eukprot:m.197445 g.197445  ORF g.197445 m.197445 type:complete len:73 (+) comp18720_c0_seq1:1106-1324(+)
MKAIDVAAATLTAEIAAVATFVFAAVSPAAPSILAMKDDMLELLFFPTEDAGSLHDIHHYACKLNIFMDTTG